MREDKGDPEEIERVINDLHRFFATLTKEQQKYADVVLYDLQNNKLVVDEGKDFIDYINEYQAKIEDDQIQRLANSFGLDIELLNNMMNLKLTEKNINEFGRFNKLMESMEPRKARKWLEEQLGTKIKPREVYQKSDKLIRQFILKGGFNIEEYVDNL